MLPCGIVAFADVPSTSVRHNGCCPPNAKNFGYFDTQWREWPCEQRPESVFPAGVGSEVIPSPAGHVPLPLPKATVLPTKPETPGAKPEEQPATGVPAQEGTTLPDDTMRLPGVGPGPGEGTPPPGNEVPAEGRGPRGRKNRPRRQPRRRRSRHWTAACRACSPRTRSRLPRRTAPWLRFRRGARRGTRRLRRHRRRRRRMRTKRLRRRSQASRPMPRPRFPAMPRCCRINHRKWCKPPPSSRWKEPSRSGRPGPTGPRPNRRRPIGKTPAAPSPRRLPAWPPRPRSRWPATVRCNWAMRNSGSGVIPAGRSSTPAARFSFPDRSNSSASWRLPRLRPRLCRRRRRHGGQRQCERGGKTGVFGLLRRPGVPVLMPRPWRDFTRTPAPIWPRRDRGPRVSMGSVAEAPSGWDERSEVPAVSCGETW